MTTLLNSQPANFDDASLRFAVLGWFISRLKNDDPQPFVASGVAIDDLDLIRNISGYQLSRISAMPTSFLRIEIDFKTIREAMESVKDVDPLQAHLSYFVEHGATNHMLRHFFRLAHADIIELRRTKNSASNNGGRTLIATVAERDSVVGLWQRIKLRPYIYMNRRQGLIDLHTAVDGRYSLATLYAIVNEFEFEKAFK